ncbi:DNA polymerase III subunit epsilon [Vreelandella malpeensis]
MDRHFALFGGSLRTVFKRESDRRRCMGTPFEWLFHPYLGKELVALALRTADADADADILSVAAVVFDERRVHTRSAWVVTLADPGRTRHATLQRHGTASLLPSSPENVGALTEFIGNRPVVGWGLCDAMAPINRLLSDRLGFELPNTQVDVAKLYQRTLRRSHLEPVGPASFGEALARSRLPAPGGASLLGEASACALLYMRLQRDAALHA